MELIDKIKRRIIVTRNIISLNGKVIQKSRSDHSVVWYINLFSLPPRYTNVKVMWSHQTSILNKRQLQKQLSLIIEKSCKL